MEEQLVKVLKAAYNASLFHYENEMSASQIVAQTLRESSLVLSPSAEQELIDYVNLKLYNN